MMKKMFLNIKYSSQDKKQVKVQENIHFYLFIVLLKLKDVLNGENGKIKKTATTFFLLKNLINLFFKSSKKSL